MFTKPIMATTTTWVMLGRQGAFKLGRNDFGWSDKESAHVLLGMH